MSLGILVTVGFSEPGSSDKSEMAKKNRTNGSNQQQVVPLPIRFCFREIQRSVIVASPHCIRLSDRMRNYELKMVHFNMLLVINGLVNKDPLFHQGILLGGPNLPFEWRFRGNLRILCCLKDRAKS